MTTRFVVRRILGGVVQVVIITFLAWVLFFVIARFTGATPALRAAGRNPSPERLAEVSHRLGTDRPYIEQYLRFLGGIFHGDFGYSFVQQRPVSEIIFPAALATASVVIGGAVVWLLIALPVGAYGALRPRSFGDVAGRTFAIIGMSIPIFWVAPMLSYALAYQPTQGILFGMHIVPVGTRLFPIDGYVKFVDDPVEWAHHLMLPWLAYATTFAAIYARYIRTLTIEQLSEDYIRTAEAKGMRTRRLLTRHVGRNVAPILAVLLGVDIGIALGGTLFVETVFNIPGLGYTGISSIQTLDYPLVTGVVTFAAIAAVAANTVVDILHGFLDPRVRIGAE
jgi:peptide/nickel transport system permease protein